jgi:hypothetical protein
MRNPVDDLDGGFDHAPPSRAHNIFKTGKCSAIHYLARNIERLTMELDALEVGAHQVRVALAGAPILMALCRFPERAYSIRARRRIADL